MKIAIYSGVIPSTTFIENVIELVAQNNTVLIFGTKKKAFSYQSEQIQIVDTPTQLWPNISRTIARSIKLLFKSPRLLSVALSQANGYSGVYKKWMRFSRFVPVLLYRPDIFHLQWANELDRWVFLKDAYGCKLVVSLLGTHINISPKVKPDLKRMYLTYFKAVDAFQSVSEDLVEELRAYGVESTKVRVIRTPIKKSILAQFQESQSNSQNLMNIVSVGRHHWVKGYSYALHAMKFLIDSGQKLTYTIIAPGKPTEELLFMAYELGLTDVLIFKSSLEHKALIKDLKSYDVMLLPSVSEGIANVAVEAMAIGLPVVSTDCGGMPELIRHQKTGWLVSKRNATALAEGLLQYVNYPFKEKQQLLERAHDLVKANYAEGSIAQQWVNFYSELIRA
ncbi:glycosyltransferase family 4 protein [Winogradskyella maritima]|uniref:Glycosyltransferase family 4 protein n=1 Tax=Winogradskyella maritima TaxID=1517766 RepID=A0ABV8AKU9_9FLAO|nr:glycosyltransferase family 4 protein [Winogradskyella maritima]